MRLLCYELCHLGSAYTEYWKIDMFVVCMMLIFRGFSKPPEVTVFYEDTAYCALNIDDSVRQLQLPQ